MTEKTIKERAQLILNRARELEEKHVGWVSFNNSIFGIGARYSKLFPTKIEREEFSKTEEFKEISAIQLRVAKKDNSLNQKNLPKVILDSNNFIKVKSDPDPVEFIFKLIIRGELSLHQTDVIYEEFYNEQPTVGRFYGVEHITFYSATHDLYTLITKYINIIESLVPEIQIVRVEPDDLVTQKDMAQRSNSDEETILNHVKDETEIDEEFPLPIARKGDTTLYSWLDVSEWLQKNTDIEIRDHAKYQAIAKVNAVLEARKHFGAKEELDDLWNFIKIM